jgi:bile acid-coenzyme A ligase
MSTGAISNIERIRRLALRSPSKTAVRHFSSTGKETRRTYGELWENVVGATAYLAAESIGPRDVVAVRVSHGLTHVVYSLATWSVGATLLPLDPGLPADRLQALRETITNLVVLGNDAAADVVPQWPIAPLPAGSRPTIAHDLSPRFARSTGGSTGRPSVGIARNPAWTTRPDHLLQDSYAGVDTDLAELGIAHDQVQLVTLPQHHAGFTCLHYGLALGQEIILLDRFSPHDSIHLMKEFRVNFLRIVPTQMRMILEIPDLDGSAFADIQAVHHGAGPCADSVKRDWISLVGKENLYETYTTAEALFHLAVRGDAWLEEPGSIGYPRPGCAVILDGSGRVCGPEEEGEVYLKSPTTALPYEQLGTPRVLRSWGDYVSVGDLGYLSKTGSLHLTGRTGQILLVGGVNVNAARVERVLLDMDGIEDAVVVGRPDPLLGQCVHAIVVLAEGTQFNSAWFQRACRRRLSASEVPTSVEIRGSLHRNASGKISRAEFEGT